MDALMEDLVPCLVSMVACPQGTMILKIVDASNHVKDAQLLFELLEEVVMEVRVENVVQVITNNASNYDYASKKLEGIGEDSYGDRRGCIIGTNHCKEGIGLGQVLW
jgi:hypothetical protein